MASKAAELVMELNEHSLVTDTLKEVDETSQSYRMVGGVLAECVSLKKYALKDPVTACRL